MKPRLRLGLIGAGFMGKAHVLGFAAAARAFDLPFRLEFACIADATGPLAAAAAARLGFARSTGDWRALACDPDIDLVDITAPNGLHREMALAAIAAGKPVYCEKPLGATAAEAREMAAAAEAEGVGTQVGFNYLVNPMLTLARTMIEAGELGAVHSFRGIHAEDYMADPATPWGFRLDPQGGGVLADLGSHALATAEHLMGPVTRLMGDRSTVTPQRPGPGGAPRKVAVEDVARVLLRFASGASGGIEASWVATGRKMQHDFEIYGERGALVFSQERFNELRHYDARDPVGRRGFRTIVAGPEHAPYGAFCVAAGHQLGFNDLKAIEIRGFLDALAGRAPPPFDFGRGARIQALVEAARDSSDEERWRDAPPA